MNRESVPVYEFFPSQKRVRVVFGSKVIADSRHAKLLRPERGPSTYYFPLEDLRSDALIDAGRTRNVADLGEARLFDVRVDGVTRTDAAWGFERPAARVGFLAGHVTFDWESMDGWFEEELEIFIGPRDPRKRIDTAPSASHVKVLYNGVTVAETLRPTLLFETGLQVRYYIPKLDVRLDLLEPSTRLTYCPYKGEARYYSLRVNGRQEQDVIWYYRFPMQEASGIASMLAFYQERVEVEVDGKRV